MGKKGAAGVVVESGRSFRIRESRPAVIEVEDTLYALGELSAKYRRAHNIPLVAVTGSNGKTTTKEMVASILSTKRRVLKNEGNLNNLIGLPLSLLKLSSAHEAGVVELGMNQRGEIARLTQIAGPTVGVITNVGPVHLERLHSVEAVAECKGELFNTMSEKATAVVNVDDPRIKRLSEGFLGTKVTFGIDHPGDVSAQNIDFQGTGGLSFDMHIRDKTIPIQLPMVGKHNVINALAAAAAITALGEAPEIIPTGLKNFNNLSLRQEIINLQRNITVINDAYNANPISMKAALDTFMRLKGNARGFAVLGDMLELGTEAPELHDQLGEQIGRSNIDYLIILGDYASYVKEGAIRAGLQPDAIIVGKQHEDLTDSLDGLLDEGDWILAKGSRGMKMEKVVGYLTRHLGLSEN